MSIPFAWLFRTRRTRLVLLILLLYAAVYILLSVCGAYRDNVRGLARLGMITKGMSDRQEWQPAFSTGQVPPGSYVSAMPGGWREAVGVGSAGPAGIDREPAAT